jgi:glyoxylase I family protein
MAVVEILGIAFAGSSSDRRAEMSAFVEHILGLPRTFVDGVEADLCDLPGGVWFAVASLGGMGSTERTIGFLVADLDSALDELRQSGAEVDAVVAENAEHRYAHFRAPDGDLDEILERRTAG